MTNRIFLSPPHVGTRERQLLLEAFDSNWIAPLGPHVEAFERAVAKRVGVPHAVALSSGTASLHLALRHLRLQPGDEVICPTLTFCASANPIVYEGAMPVFVDSECGSWNLDPWLLAKELDRCAARGRLPRAVIAVDIYGQSADMQTIVEVASRYDIPVIEDAAEALGATYRDRSVGTLGWASFFSFNGNKIITTSGGGMLCSDDSALIDHVRFLATQARDPAPHYQHSQVGFNYRLSNLLAAVGIGQLESLDEYVAARRRVFAAYQSRLGHLPGVSFMPEASFGHSNRWLTVLQVDAEQFGTTPQTIQARLEAEQIEARRAWKPLHLQPVFANSRCVGGQVAERIFQRGLCLPSGTGMTDDDIERVCRIIRSCCNANGQTASRHVA